MGSVVGLLLLACSSQEPPQSSPAGSGGNAGSDAGSPLDGISIDERYLSCSNCGITVQAPIRQPEPNDCTFALAVAPPDPYNVKVQATSNAVVVTVPPEAGNGWVFEVGFLSITFNGSSCQQVRDGTLTDPRVLFGCPLCPIP